MWRSTDEDDALGGASPVRAVVIDGPSGMPPRAATVPATQRTGAPTVLKAILAGVSLVAVAVPAVLVRNAPDTPAPSRVRPPQRVVPPVELPPVEPTRFVQLAPEDAQAVNATVPFSTAPNPAARPFRFAGGADDLARATDCLAAAVIYEAGDDSSGGRAVAQVILNRLRHPAFPKTVCGVVFQGQERSTGCQFTFTCDGALTRWRPSEPGWRRAREVAAMALAGSVDARVGHATHYHTDWVVPYWSSSLDKIAAVGTHLFFRWTGWWGTPPAFNRRHGGAEPGMAKIAHLSDAHRGAAGVLTTLEPMGAAEGQVTGVLGVGPAPIPLADQQSSFLVTLPKGLPPERWPALAARACGDRPYCKMLGWTEARRTATGLPLSPAQIQSLSFSYLRDRADGYERTLWNCQQVKRADPLQCMKQQLLMPAPMLLEPAPQTNLPPRGPAELSGVRRRWTDAADRYLPGAEKASVAQRPAPAASPTPAPAAAPPVQEP
jgi:spore germination cell wall hydrolase CwlJ-like protein